MATKPRPYGVKNIPNLISHADADLFDSNIYFISPLETSIKGAV
jgi:hypothetical protein